MKGKTMIRQNSIKNILREKGMTQKELCEAIGQDHINFNKIINNKRGLDHHMAHKVAEVLGVQWFQVYEPMNTKLMIHGYITASDLDNPQIKLLDPIEDKPEQIILHNYLDDPDNIICIHECDTKAVFLMKKNKKETYPSVDGMHYAKLKDGTLKFLLMHNGVIRQWNPHVSIQRKTLRQKPKLQYSIPVSRIDYDFVKGVD